MSSATPPVHGSSESSESTFLVRIDFEAGWNRIGDTADATFGRGPLRWHLDIRRIEHAGFLLTGTRWNDLHVRESLDAHLASVTLLQEWFHRRNVAFEQLLPYITPSNWRTGTVTSDVTWAALAHMYQALTSEGTHDVVSVLQELMQTPTRDGVATRLRRVRAKGFLTASTQGVVAGEATQRAQAALPWSWTWPQG